MDSESFTQQLSRETVNKLFAFYSGMNITNDEMRENLMVYVNEFIQLVIAQALQDYNPKESKKKKMAQVASNFANLKEAIEVQVGKALTQAILQYAGQKIIYHCVLTTSLGPMNAVPC